MAIRTTVDIPEALHEEQRKRAERSGASVRSLIVRALEQTYGNSKKRGAYVTGPLIKLKGGKLGKSFPKDKSPHGLVFS
jgi:hypothetical protein